MARKILKERKDKGFVYSFLYVVVVARGDDDDGVVVKGKK